MEVEDGKNEKFGVGDNYQECGGRIARSISQHLLRPGQMFSRNYEIVDREGGISLEITLIMRLRDKF